MPDTSIVVLVTREGMGYGEPELQIRLLKKYLTLLLQNKSLPDVICSYMDGVKLVVDGSAVLEELRQLERHGVRLVVCSTCLEYYGLQDRLRAGIIGGMPDIIEAQWRADRVITI